MEAALEVWETVDVNRDEQIPEIANIIERHTHAGEMERLLRRWPGVHVQDVPTLAEDTRALLAREISESGHVELLCEAREKKLVAALVEALDVWVPTLSQVSQDDYGELRAFRERVGAILPRPCYDNFGHNTEACMGLESASHLAAQKARQRERGKL